MADRNAPDLSHLRGAEIERIARSLTAGTVEAVLADKDALVALKTEDLKKISDLLAVSPAANCGGFGCG